MDKKVNYGVLIVAILVVVLMFLSIILYAVAFNKTKDRYTQLYVVARFRDDRKAAMILYNLNAFGFKLFERMSKKYTKPMARTVIDRMMTKYDPDMLEENDPVNPFEHKTYTTNFKTITICIRKKDGKFYDFHTLQFVFMHELAHIASLEREHGDTFWRIFKFILLGSAGIYSPADYSKRPIEYCGIPVNHSPYYENYDVSDLV